MSGSKEILFVSDLHLDRDKPEITRNFLHFLETRAVNARVLYILGDLFEVWLGDDDEAEHLHPLFEALQALSRKVEILFLHGNRDFLVGEQLAQRCGMSLFEEPRVITLGKHRVGLMHGDLLCTDDVDYQKFRTMVRGDEWQQQFLSQPLAERQRLAAALRDKSSAAMQAKTIDIMDVNQQAVEQRFAELDIDVLIHGHTHRPAMHSMSNNRRRIVLGDWQPEPSYLSWAEGEFTLVDPRV